jgi:phosphoglycerate dehydrogenase-like enzyme
MTHLNGIAPLLPETVGMIRGAHLASMKEGATFINTARGALVHEAELVMVLRQRPDLQAVLDVTDPEPPPADLPLYSLANVMLTPHIAGALDGECRRLGRVMVEELGRCLRGATLHGEVLPQQAALRA